MRTLLSVWVQGAVPTVRTRADGPPAAFAKLAFEDVRRHGPRFCGSTVPWVEHSAWRKQCTTASRPYVGPASAPPALEDGIAPFGSYIWLNPLMRLVPTCVASVECKAARHRRRGEYQCLHLLLPASVRTYCREHLHASTASSELNQTTQHGKRLFKRRLTPSSLQSRWSTI